MVSPVIEFINGQFHANQMAVRSGGTIYGTDAGKWPAWWSDAVEILTSEQRYANAIIGITNDGR